MWLIWHMLRTAAASRDYARGGPPSSALPSAREGAVTVWQGANWRFGTTRAVSFRAGFSSHARTNAVAGFWRGYSLRNFAPRRCCALTLLHGCFGSNFSFRLEANRFQQHGVDGTTWPIEARPSERGHLLDPSAGRMDARRHKRPLMP